MIDRAVRVVLGTRGVRSQHVDSGHARHHVYVVEGGGRLPPIVLLHGLSDSATTFAPLLLRLRRHAQRVTIIEAAGHGLSDEARCEYTPAVHMASMTRVLDAVIDEPALVVGNSLGGATAIRYALASPERVRGLVLVSPAAAPIDDAASEMLRRAFELRSPDEAVRFLARICQRRPPAARLVAGKLVAQANRTAVRDLLRTASAEDALTPAELGAINVPTWLLWGRAERLLPPSMLTYLRTHLPAHAVVASPERFGHCPHLDQPGRLARMVLTFAELATTTRVRVAPLAIRKAG